MSASSRTAVATTAVLIPVAETGTGQIIVTNSGAALVYLGDPTVSTSSGFALAAGASVNLDRISWPGLFAISATSSTVDALSA